MEEVATADGFAARNALLLRNTSIGNFFDLCAISLPRQARQLVAVRADAVRPPRRGPEAVSGGGSGGEGAGGCRRSCAARRRAHDPHGEEPCAQGDGVSNHEARAGRQAGSGASILRDALALDRTLLRMRVKGGGCRLADDGSRNRTAHRADAVDAAFDLVALGDRGDAGGGAGHDDVAGADRDLLRQL